MRRLIYQFPQHHFLLVTPENFSTDFLEKANNFELVLCPFPNWRWSKLAKLYYHLIKYPACLKKQKGDFFIASYYDFLIPLFYRSRSVHFVYDLCYWKVPDCYSWFSRTFHKFLFYCNKNRSLKILTISESSKKDIIQFYPELDGKIMVIPCSFESEWQNSIYSEEFIGIMRKRFNPDNKKVLLYTGGIDPRKNIQRMLIAFTKFVEKNPNYLLIITGKNNGELNQLIDQYKIQDSVAVAGYLEKDDLGCLYKNIANFVLTVSLYEGFGLTNLEAKAVGLPLLSSNIPVFKEIMRDYPIYCDPYSVESIVQGLKLLSQQELTTTIAEIDERYKPGVSEEQFAKLIEHYL